MPLRPGSGGHDERWVAHRACVVPIKRGTTRRRRARGSPRGRAPDRSAARGRRARGDVGDAQGPPARLGPRPRREGAARDEPGHGVRLPGLRVARGPGGPPRRARVLRERRQGARRGGDHGARHARAVRAGHRRRPAPALGLRAGPARADHRAAGPRGAALPGDRLGRGAGHDRRRPARGRPRRDSALHLGPHQQRGGVPLPAARASPRDQQLPRLLEHVPRVERHRADRDHRHRQGHGVTRRLRPRGPDPRDRPEPRHQPPAHAVDAARGRPPRCHDRQHQPAARGGAREVRPPAEAARPARRHGPREAVRPGPDRRGPGVPPRGQQGGARARAGRARRAVPRRAHRGVRGVARARARGAVGHAGRGRRRRRGDHPAGRGPLHRRPARRSRAGRWA